MTRFSDAIANTEKSLGHEIRGKNTNWPYLPISAIAAGLVCVTSGWGQAACVMVSVLCALKFLRDSLMTAMLHHVSYLISIENSKLK